MKKLLAPALAVSVFLAACNNEGTRTGNVDDTAKVSPPTDKIQDSTSLTDTSYRISDSAK